MIPSTIAGRWLGIGSGSIVPAPHTAVVYALDGIRFVAAATSRRALMRRLAEYVEQHVGDKLWARDAGIVRQLLATEAHDEAVELYFAMVGQRWDEEWIVVADPGAS